MVPPSEVIKPPSVVIVPSSVAIASPPQTEKFAASQPVAPT